MTFEKSLNQIINESAAIGRSRALSINFAANQEERISAGKQHDKYLQEEVTQPLAKLVRASTLTDFTEDFLNKNYPHWRRYFDDKEHLFEIHKVFIIDYLSHIFIHHGADLINSETTKPVSLPKTAFKESDSQFFERRKRVLYTQNMGSTGIVIGKMPEWRVVNEIYLNHEPSHEEQGYPIHDSAYIYIEHDEFTMPGITWGIDGNAKISEDAPILYFAKPFPEKAPIREKGLMRQIRFLLPNSYYDSSVPYREPVLKRGTQRV
jgi:hypothetical protein